MMRVTPRPRRSGCLPNERRRARHVSSSALMSSATSWPAWGGRCATPRREPGSCAGADRDRDTMADRELIYGRRPVAEAERGRRAVHRVWRAPETSAEELERMAGSPDHQGVVAEVDPYPYVGGDDLLRPGALLLALDQ